MAKEILFIVTGSPGSQVADAIAIKEPGAPWGSKEQEPPFFIARVSDAAAAQVDVGERVDTSGQVPVYVYRCKNRVDVESLAASDKSAIATGLLDAVASPAINGRIIAALVSTAGGVDGRPTRPRDGR